MFHDFLEEGSVHTLLPRVKENPKLFVLRAFTKMYGMAGLRLGYGICSDTELIRRMEQVTQPGTYRFRLRLRESRLQENRNLWQ